MEIHAFSSGLARNLAAFVEPADRCRDYFAAGADTEQYVAPLYVPPHLYIDRSRFIGTIFWSGDHQHGFALAMTREHDRWDVARIFVADPHGEQGGLFEALRRTLAAGSFVELSVSADPVAEISTWLRARVAGADFAQ